MATTARQTQRQRREHTQRRLLDAARQVFGARGYGAASLDEIAQAAGVTRGALYYNFPRGKQDLFFALLDERLAERADAIRDRFAGPADVAGTVEQASGAADDAFAAVGPNREWQLLTYEFALHAARDREFAARYVEHEDAVRAVIQEVIEARARQLGGRLPLAARDLAIGMNALGAGLALDALVEPDSVPEQLFGRLVGLMVRGMVAEMRDQRGAGA